MRPNNLKTRIFLDSGDPKEAHKIIDHCHAVLELCGFLDGQTTNPSLIAKNPEAKKRIEAGEKFSRDEVWNFYKQVVQEISQLILEGSVSIEVYADATTTAEEMVAEGEKFFKWIPNAHIKLPTTAAGLEAAEKLVKKGIRVNMTLVFSQEQAAAVHAATRGAGRGDVFLSPFIGRVDDRGENGMDLIANILKMYDENKSHVEVLTASVRSYEHFMGAIELGSNIITSPLKFIEEWHEKGMPARSSGFVYDAGDLFPISFKNLDLKKSWQEFDVSHELTDQGIEKFASDWNKLIK